MVQRSFSINVNGTPQQPLLCAKSGNEWGDKASATLADWSVAEATLSLKQGENSIVIGGADDDDAPNLDYVDVVWSSAVGTRVAGGVSVGSDPVIIHFTNTPGVELPSTGGAGTLPYTLSGWLLLLAAALMLYNQKRLGKEGVRN